MGRLPFDDLKCSPSTCPRSIAPYAGAKLAERASKPRMTQDKDGSEGLIIRALDAG